MKKFYKIGIFVMVFLAISCAFASGKTSSDSSSSSGKKIFITTNGEKMSVSLADTSAANALFDLIKSKGTVTVNAHDYGSFEKVGDLPTSLPRNDTQITTKNGDVILYQGKSIVIFYGSNSWSYTRLGSVDEPFRSRLKTILGSGDVALVLSVE